MVPAVRGWRRKLSNWTLFLVGAALLLLALMDARWPLTPTSLLLQLPLSPGATAALMLPVGQAPMIAVPFTPRSWSEYSVVVGGEGLGCLRVDLQGSDHDHPLQEGHANGRQQAFRVVLRCLASAPSGVRLRIFGPPPTRPVMIHSLTVRGRSLLRSIYPWATLLAGALWVVAVARCLRGQHRTTAILGTTVLAISFAVTGHWDVAASADNQWYIPAAEGLLRRGSLSLEPLRDEIVARGHYGVALARDGTAWNFFPPGPSLLLLPSVAVAELVPMAPAILAGLMARGWYALTIIVVFMLLGRLGCSSLVAWCGAGLLALASSHLSLHAVEIWSSGPVLLLQALGLLLALRSERWWSACLAGVCAGMAYLCRPDAALIVLQVLGLVAWLAWKIRAGQQRWRCLLPFVLTTTGAMVVIVPFMAWSWIVFGSYVPPYYAGGRLAWGGWAIGSAGQWFSPNRGWLIYHPYLLIGFAAVPWLLLRDQWLRPWVVASVLHILVATTVIAAFPHWWGGHSFGPRLQAPLLLSALLPVLLVLDMAWRGHLGRWPGRTVLAGVALCGLLAAAIHLAGASSPATHAWNRNPRDVDQAPERVWDWHDWQPARAIDRPTGSLP